MNITHIDDNNNNRQKNNDHIPHPILIDDHEQNNGIKSLNNIYTCSICCEVAYEPEIIYPCEHIFCKICIRQALEVQYECPNDRTEPTDVEPLSGALQRIYQQLPVRCPHAPQCFWRGTMDTYNDHTINCPAIMALNTIKEYENTIKEYENKISKYEEENSTLLMLNEELNQKNQQLKQDNEKLFNAIYVQLPRIQQLIDTIIVKIKVDENYNYDRTRIIELTQLICQYLEDKPDNINSNRIFTCIWKYYRAWEYNYNDNPINHETDLRMLLHVCRATSTWFTDRQGYRLDEWSRNIGI